MALFAAPGGGGPAPPVFESPYKQANFARLGTGAANNTPILSTPSEPNPVNGVEPVEDPDRDGVAPLTVGNLRQQIRLDIDNPDTAMPWNTNYTREQAALHAIMCYTEIADMAIPRTILGDRRITRGRDRSQPGPFETSFHCYYVA